MQVTRYSSKSVCVIKTRCKDTHYFFIPAQKNEKIPKIFGNFKNSSYLCTSFQWKLACATARCLAEGFDPPLFFI